MQICNALLGNIPNKHQVTIIQTTLVNLINIDHELAHLAQHIDWDEVENEFKGYFSENGRLNVNVRRIVGLMLLKSLFNLNDESTVARWVESCIFNTLPASASSRLSLRSILLTSPSSVAASARKEPRSY